MMLRPQVRGRRMTPRYQPAALSSSVVVTIDEPYGVALRVAPDSSAKILINVGCGTVLPVVQSQGGWFQVRQQSINAWVGGGRVASGLGAAPAACAGAPVPTYQMGM